MSSHTQWAESSFQNSDLHLLAVSAPDCERSRRSPQIRRLWEVLLWRQRGVGDSEHGQAALAGWVRFATTPRNQHHHDLRLHCICYNCHPSLVGCNSGFADLVGKKQLNAVHH